MKQLHLSPRLALAASWVAPGAAVADIGTDHGYLPAWLIQNGICSRAIAADLRPGPLQRARETAAQYGVAEQLSFRLCNGLEGIAPSEADTVIIAGMGGETIISILAAAPWTRNGPRLILQPQTHQPELRRWLQASGYTILQEGVARDGKMYYALLLAAGGRLSPLTPGEQLAGRPSLRQPCPDWPGYLDWLLRRTERQLVGAAQSSKKADCLRAEWLISAREELLTQRSPVCD